MKAYDLELEGGNARGYSTPYLVLYDGCLAVGKVIVAPRSDAERPKGAGVRRVLDLVKDTGGTYFLSSCNDEGDNSLLLRVTADKIPGKDRAVTDYFGSGLDCLAYSEKDGREVSLWKMAANAPGHALLVRSEAEPRVWYCGRDGDLCSYSTQDFIDQVLVRVVDNMSEDEFICELRRASIRGDDALYDFWSQAKAYERV